jgi:hypothetical protein
LKRIPRAVAGAMLGACVMPRSRMTRSRLMRFISPASAHATTAKLLAGWLAGSTRLDQHMGRRQARWPVRLGGDRRLRQGDDSVNDRLKDVLIANSQATSRELATYAARATEKGFTKESDVLSQHRLIRIITMSLSGFSRGAALSRAFSNRVIGQCDNKHGDDPYFHSYRLHLQFMGVFDIVASFGVPSTNARRPFQERDLIVSLRCAT